MRTIDADYIIENETNKLHSIHRSTFPELIEHIGVDDEYFIYTTELQSYANQKMMLAYLRSVLKNAPTVDAVPVVRFGQMMFAVNDYIETCEETDPFYIEDEEMIEYIKSTFLHKLSVGGEHNL